MFAQFSHLSSALLSLIKHTENITHIYNTFSGHSSVRLSEASSYKIFNISKIIWTGSKKPNKFWKDISSLFHTVVTELLTNLCTSGES